MSTFALGYAPQADMSADRSADIRIPPRPCGQHAATRPAAREAAWREAMRWSLLGLTASLAAGEVALALFGP